MELVRFFFLGVCVCVSGGFLADAIFSLRPVVFICCLGLQLPTVNSPLSLKVEYFTRASFLELLDDCFSLSSYP